MTGGPVFGFCCILWVIGLIQLWLSLAWAQTGSDGPLWVGLVCVHLLLIFAGAYSPYGFFDLTLYPVVGLAKCGREKGKNKTLFQVGEVQSGLPFLIYVAGPPEPLFSARNISGGSSALFPLRGVLGV